MTYLELTTMLKVKMSEKLKSKTGWGRNEILTALDEVLIEVLASKLDGQPKDALV